MELKIKARNFYLDGVDCAHIGKEANRLRRRLPGTCMIKVELTQLDSTYPDHRIVAQVILRYGGTTLKHEQHGANPRTAVEMAMDVLLHKTESYDSRVDIKTAGSNLIESPYVVSSSIS